jgi:hypothetical protein
MLKLILILFTVTTSSVFSQIPGEYKAFSNNKDGDGKIIATYYLLNLNTDSTFSYLTESKTTENCKNTSAGYWKYSKGRVLLEFIGDQPWIMELRQDHIFIFLERRDGLTFSKEHKTVHALPSHPSPSKKKKHKDTPCPRF